MTKTVYSITGAEINLADATIESLAEVIDEMSAEIASLKEARQFVMTEVSRRMDGKARQSTDGWTLSNRPYVHVTRQHD